MKVPRTATLATTLASLIPVLCAPAAAAAPAERFAGVDLSYVNEMEACGAEFRAGGVRKDPYEIFAAAGANLVRLRLWNAPAAPTAEASTGSGVTRRSGTSFSSANCGQRRCSSSALVWGSAWASL